MNMSGRTHDILGRRAALEALKSDMPVSRVVLSDNVGKDKQVDDIIKIAQNRGIRVDRLPASDFEKRYGDAIHPHQGVALIAPEFEYAALEEIIANADAAYDANQRSLVIICDHITDAGNLGAIARSAESVGAAGLVIPNKRSAQVTPATYKTSAGAIAHLAIAQVPNLHRTLDQLKEAGFWVVGATEHVDELVWDVDLVGRIALVLGNEHAGISDLILKNCDLCCSLPQIGEVSSLNVAQASTVLMYEWLRQNMSA